MSTIQKLAAYGACDVADALIKLKHPTGGFLSGLVLRGPTSEAKIIGRAHTILFKRQPIAPQEKHFSGHYLSPVSHMELGKQQQGLADVQIDSVTPGSVLFLSAPADIPNAVYGGLMSMRAKRLGAIGTVVDGRLRDLAEHRSLQYPVFSRDVGITAGQEACYSSAINVPVPLRSPHQPDVWVHPGDIIVGDENGLACIPQALEEEVAKLVPLLAERDHKVMQALREGATGEEAFKLRS